MKKKKQKVAIITGASRGIGKAIALKLDKEGFITVLISRQSKNLKVALKDFSKRAVAILTDVSREKEVIAMVQKVVKRFGRIDVLINSAGSWTFKKIDELSKKNFNEAVGNFGGVFYCSRECVKQMKKQSQGGQIINISSDIARVFLPSRGLFRRSLYTAIHGAIGHFATAIQSETGINKIKIATIYIGLTSTDWVLDERRCDTEDVRKYALKPDDIAHVAWMIINQGENSNISEVVIRPLADIPRKNS